MALSTLADLVPEMERLGDREALRYDNGFRTFRFSYRELLGRVRIFQGYLASRDVGSGSRVILWSENRPEWVFAFWACVLSGIQVVPLDSHSSLEMIGRILEQVEADLLLHGEETDAASWPNRARLTRVSCNRYPMPPPSSGIDPEQPVQILFTSGTTGRPSGVIHRHRNICSNLEPFRLEIERYRWIAWPFQPVRILNLLPLSHMFGQSMGLFIPVLLGGSVVLSRRHSPRVVLSTIRDHRVSVVCLVPRMMRGLRDEIAGVTRQPITVHSRVWTAVVARWWRHRSFHRRVGLRFWAFVVGGAAVEQDLEEFWKELGFAVVQGYGLTESSPVVAVNHPFRSQLGALGEAVPGQEIKLAPDGEILVRGPSVASERIGPGGRREELLEDGWLHTGDIGRFDSHGRLYFLGRKKDVIVTSSGLNVHPEDLEAVLNRLEGVRESAVVAERRSPGEEIVHAALILEDGATSARELISQANLQLLEHQRIRSWSVWPEDDFPRTVSTGKVRRHRVAQQIRGASPVSRPADPLEHLLPDHGLGKGEVRLDEDLGLSSLDRVELLGRVEDRLGVTISETAMAEAETVEDLQALIRGAEPAGAEAGGNQSLSRVPRLSRSLPARGLRWAFLNLVMSPLFRLLMDLEKSGVGTLQDLDPPLMFAANHGSHLDTAALLAALPTGWRSRIAPAAKKEHFAAFWSAGSSLREKLSAGGKFGLACLLFGAFPLPQQLGQVGDTLRYAGELAEGGLCILIYPEGKRSRDGLVQPFKSGVGLLARELDLPVIPVGIRGTFESLSVHDSWPRRGPVRIAFGRPLRLKEGETPDQLAARLEAAVRQLTGQ